MQDAVQLINNPKAKDMRIFVLVNSICDALFLSENIDDIERINIANVGRFDGVDETEKSKLSSTILLSKSEQVALEQLLASNRKIVHQIVPDNAEKLFHDLMSN